MIRAKFSKGTIFWYTALKGLNVFCLYTNITGESLSSNNTALNDEIDDVTTTPNCKENYEMHVLWNFKH